MEHLLKGWLCDDASDSWVFVRYLPAFSSIDFSDEKVWIVDATTVASAIAVRSTFLFNPNLHALHNWKGTSTLERILMSSSLKVESRLPHEFNLANAPFSKLDTWSSESTISWSEEDNAKKKKSWRFIFVLRHTVFEYPTKSLIASTGICLHFTVHPQNSKVKLKWATRSEFLKHKNQWKNYCPTPFLKGRHELGKVKSHRTLSTFFLHLLSSIQHVFWCHRKIRTMGLEDSLSVYYCFACFAARGKSRLTSNDFPSFYDCFWKVELEYFS